MPNNEADPVARQRQRDHEMRAAVDVMFEALSHIQASLETSSEEKRMESYRKFKEALYDRFEHLLEEQRPSPDGQPAQVGGTDTPTDAVLEETEEGDTLEKLWPAIAKKG